jgi:threonine synthase
LARKGFTSSRPLPAAPAALNALRDDGVIPANEVVLIVLTGSGLKAIDTIVEHYASREPVAV